jgi:hypothetical protein
MNYFYNKVQILERDITLLIIDNYINNLKTNGSNIKFNHFYFLNKFNLLELNPEGIDIFLGIVGSGSKLMRILKEIDGKHIKHITSVDKY